MLSNADGLVYITSNIASAAITWNLNKNRSYKYKIGDMPIAEDLHFRSYIGIGLTHYDFSTNDIYYIINAFRKVWTNLGLKIINDN